MESKFIEGVKPLQQFMDDGSFLMPEIPAVLRAAQALHFPAYVDYDYLLSVSGMAVRLAWQQGWAEYADLPNQAIFYNQDHKSTTALALERIGISYMEKSVSGAAMEDVRREIQASLDRDIPVLLHGGPEAQTVILGYSGADFYGVSTFADPDKRETPHDYNKIENWEDKIDTYTLITSYTPRIMDRHLFKDTLKTAVYLARTSRVKSHGDTALGISSFDALAEMLVWDESFEPLEAGRQYSGKIHFPYDRPAGYYRTDGAGSLEKRFWAGYCDFLCMLNGYDNFSRFLEKYAGIFPEWSEKIREAAAYYHCACRYSGELWKYVTPDDKGAAKFKESGVRYTFAAHMLRAKIYTVKAVEILEKILADAL